MSEKALAVWKSPAPIAVPTSVTSLADLSAYVTGLSKDQFSKIQAAYDNKAYDMAAEYVWRRSINRLKLSLSSLGMGFIAEMLDRTDIDENANPEFALNEIDTLYLCEELGVINSRGAMHLRHACEVIQQYTSDGEMPAIDCLSLVKNCVQYVLSIETPEVAVDFSRFSETLTRETLSASDSFVKQLQDSKVFYLRTTIRTLSSCIKSNLKSKKIVRLEHALANFDVIVPLIWPNLPDPDRYFIGNLYLEVVGSGNESATSALKRTLIKIGGFDFVPENLRSNSFKEAAQAIISAHYNYNNFYTELTPTSSLALMGTSIPYPALAYVVNAYLCVFLGNSYGSSNTASPIAREELAKLPQAKWTFYLEKALPSDKFILEKLSANSTIPKSNFIKLVKDLNLDSLVSSTSKVSKILTAAAKNRIPDVRAEAANLLNAAGGNE